MQTASSVGLRMNDDTVAFTPAFTAPSGKSQLERETEIARAAGYTAGWTSGSQAARVAGKLEHDARMLELEERVSLDRRALHQATQALITASARVDASLRPDFGAVEDAILDTALELARAILQHEIRTSTTPGLDALRRALSLSSTEQPLQVRLHPADAATLANPLVRTELGVPEGLQIVPDHSLQPGDAIAEYPNGSVESRLAEALDRAREVLGR